MIMKRKKYNNIPEKSTNCYPYLKKKIEIYAE